MVSIWTRTKQQLESQQWFEKKSPGWGRLSIMPLNELHAKDAGFLVNGDLKIVVEIDVLEVVGRLDVTEETSTIIETMDVNGFQILPSHAESVSRMFERHSELASEFRPKNPNLRTAYISYMNLLLSLIDTLRQSPHELPKDDLDEAHYALESLTDAGFKLDWLEKKISQVSEMKEKEKDGEIRRQEIETELKDLKQKCSDVEAQLEKEKSKALAAKTLSFLTPMAKQVGHKFTWVIKDFSSLREKCYSPPVQIGDCKWRLSVYPKGIYISDHLSLFLEVADVKSLPFGWRRLIKFRLTIAKQVSEGPSVLKSDSYFTLLLLWGFPTMIPLAKIHDKNEGFLVNDQLMIVAEVDVLEVVGTSEKSEETNPLSQVESVSSVQDSAVEFRARNEHLKTACTNVLLSLTQTLCQTPQELSVGDLVEAEKALAYMKDTGLEVEWLVKKLNEVKEKKEAQSG
ncbi:hypothetical protein F2Q69_00049403 [Brassica cretica]|uniref:MATH domain-containing protein n=1 Tax=Brassica cretica TaxID=69181 RepID=A0A8S9PQA6_BRACR|nr:hypothetical protein F2Q69_00049403 [Brassica cretica]